MALIVYLKLFGKILTFSEYNGFIATGLLWGLFQGAEGYGFKVFFLLCVVVAGVFGAATVSRRILFIQAVPGIVGLLLVVASS